MTITYRTSGAWGAGKGANLTAAEVDANFHDIDERLTAVEDNPAQAVQIDNITSSGSALTITMDNGDSYGPLILPVAAFVFRDWWEPSTVYSRNDIIINANKLYLVTANHTSDLTFSTSRTISGVNVYQMMFDLDEISNEIFNYALGNGTHFGISYTANLNNTIDSVVDFLAGTEAYQDAIGSAINTGTQTGITVVYDDANNTIDFTVPVEVSIGAAVSGAPDDSQAIVIPVTRSLSLAADATGSTAKALVAATAQTDISVKKNGSSIGTIRFAAAGTTASFVGISQTSFAAGDVLVFTFPATADATLADIGIALKFTVV